MRLSNRWVFTFASVITSVLVCHQATAGEVLSFKAWRSRRVLEAKSQLNESKEALKQQNKVEGPHFQELKTRLEQESLNVKIAQELSANDYFVLYLTEQFKGDPRAIREAVQKMSQQELAEILVNYQKQLLKDNEPRPVPQSALLEATVTSSTASAAPVRINK